MTDDHQLGDAPIEEQYRAKMQHLARAIDEFFNDGATGDDRQTGFCLMVFPLDGFDGRANYISNAKREDIVVLLKEQLARFEGQPEMKGRA
jgi:hypothetical protein